MSTPLHLILLAGGRGLRAGQATDVPKQFRITGQGALFAVGLRAFQTPPDGAACHLASVTVTAPMEWHDTVSAEIAGGGRPWCLATPGATRTVSTGNAVEQLTAKMAPGPDDLVAVHDAARPFATVQLLDKLTVAALAHGGAIPGVPVTDTIVQVGEGVADYLERGSLVAVQTPQVFRWRAFAAAHRWARQTGASFTDDGGLLASQGQSPVVVAGEPDNWKVTTAVDWARAADILR